MSDSSVSGKYQVVLYPINTEQQRYVLKQINKLKKQQQQQQNYPLGKYVSVLVLKYLTCYSHERKSNKKTIMNIWRQICRSVPNKIRKSNVICQR